MSTIHIILLKNGPHKPVDIPIHAQLNNRQHLQSSPLSSYTIISVMLQLLETIMELLFWNNLVHCHHLFMKSLMSWNFVC
jgi:hypothetical protein